MKDDFKLLEISLTLEDIKISSENMFKKFVQELPTNKALEYINSLKMNQAKFFTSSIKAWKF